MSYTQPAARIHVQRSGYFVDLKRPLSLFLYKLIKLISRLSRGYWIIKWISKWICNWFLVGWRESEQHRLSCITELEEAQELLSQAGDNLTKSYDKVGNGHHRNAAYNNNHWNNLHNNNHRNNAHLTTYNVY